MYALVVYFEIVYALSFFSLPLILCVALWFIYLLLFIYLSIYLFINVLCASMCACVPHPPVVHGEGEPR